MLDVYVFAITKSGNNYGYFYCTLDHRLILNDEGPNQKAV